MCEIVFESAACYSCVNRVLSESVVGYSHVSKIQVESAAAIRACMESHLNLRLGIAM